MDPLIAVYSGRIAVREAETDRPLDPMTLQTIEDRVEAAVQAAYAEIDRKVTVKADLVRTDR